MIYIYIEYMYIYIYGIYMYLYLCNIFIYIFMCVYIYILITLELLHNLSDYAKEITSYFTTQHAEMS